MKGKQRGEGPPSPVTVTVRRHGVSHGGSVVGRSRHSGS
jgi:hypothetical protein